VKLYINGVLQSSGYNVAGAGAPLDDRQNALAIGRYSPTNIRQFDGFIDDVQIYSQSLTGFQVGFQYNSAAVSQ
jgi:hypothetical protein